MELEKRYYRPTEVASLLGVSVMTVYRLIKDGDLIAVKSRKRIIFIDPDEIRKFMGNADEDQKALWKYMEGKSQPSS